MTGPDRDLIRLGLGLLSLAALSACAERAPAPPPKAPTAQLAAATAAYSGLDIHCVDRREVNAFLGLKLSPGPHKVVVSYSVCGVDRNCTDFFGEVAFTAVAGASYRVEGALPLKATTAKLTVVNSKDGTLVAGPFPGARNALGEDPKEHFACAAKATG
jgi:hypothetical protein